MDEQMHNEPTPEEHMPVAAPVMDIKPPVAIERPHGLPANPAMPQSSDTKQDNHHQKMADQPTPNANKQPGNGAAIFATVVIVIVLAALATYAYLKTAK